MELIFKEVVVELFVILIPALVEIFFLFLKNPYDMFKILFTVLDPHVASLVYKR